MRVLEAQRKAATRSTPPRLEGMVPLSARVPEEALLTGAPRVPQQDARMSGSGARRVLAASA